MLVSDQLLDRLRREHRSLRARVKQLALAIEVLSRRRPRPKAQRRTKVKRGA